MNNIRIYPAKVVTAEKDCTITFNIPGATDNFTSFPSATPMFYKTLQVYPDDDVLIWQLNEEIDEFMYLPYNPSDGFAGINVGNCQIDLSDGENIDIKVLKYKEQDNSQADSNATMAEKLKGTPKPEDIEATLSEIYITNELITLNSNDDSGELKSSITLNNEGKIEINGTVSTTINPGKMGKLTMEGTATPSGQGFMCAVPNCLFTGAPHVGTEVMNFKGINIE
jgi:hypothetical protein